VSGPDRLVRSTDGTPIAVFESGVAEPGTRPLLLVHGTTADHLTFRVVGPILGRRRRRFAIDRRGRGASGDGTGTGDGYAIEREFEDVAAVSEALAAEHGGPVDVVGHSYGGRCALGASLLTPSIRRVVSYEGAPAPASRPYQPDDLAARLRAHLDRGDPAAALETFFREVVGFDDAAMADFRASPVWPLRVAAAHTIPRELVAERSPAASLDALGGVTVPVLQVLGTASKPAFEAATAALDARLARGSVVRIQGAAHAAHHTHPAAFIAAIEAFLDADAS
jgi:pimeloyl-ACP methyl ester carboxylesterase